MNTDVKKHLSLSLLVVSIALLSGCLPESDNDKEASAQASHEGPKSIEDGSEVLLKIDGRPVVTMNSLNAEFDKLLEENPQMKQILPFMPDAKANFLQGMVNQEVVDHYVSVNGIDSTAEYKNEYKKTMDQVKKMLNTKYFGEKHPVSVSSGEINAFYEENKNKIPDLMISQGGVKAEGVSFDDEKEAKAFMAKAKETKDKLEKVAKDAKLGDNYQDFKMVDDKRMDIDPALRAKITGLKKFPAHEIVKVGDAWWVVKAHSKEEPKYRPLEDQLKQSLEEHLKKQKQMEVFEKAIDGYKKDFNVEVNDAPLKPKAEDKKSAEDAVKNMANASTAQREDSAKEIAEAPQQAMQTV